MPVTLIYHQPEEPEGTPSPIKEAIDQMVRGQHVDIACPYLSLPYLEQIIKQASSWRLLSDVDQWIGSQETKDSQSKICNFIKKKKNSRRVRDYRKLHAKVIIAKENAFVGSANFTNSGLGKREEMCVLLERTSEVAELHAWFDRLWELSDPANRNGLSLLIRDRPNQTIPDSPYRRSSTAPRINSKLEFSTKKPSAPVAKNNPEATSGNPVNVGMFTPDNLIAFEEKVGPADKNGCRPWLGARGKYTGKEGARRFGIFRRKGNGYVMNQRFAFIMAQPQAKRDTSVHVEPITAVCKLGEMCCTPAHIRAQADGALERRASKEKAGAK